MFYYCISVFILQECCIIHLQLAVRDLLKLVRHLYVRRSLPRHEEIAKLWTWHVLKGILSLLVMFNLVYTSLPIIVFGLCEQNVEAKVLMASEEA